MFLSHTTQTNKQHYSKKPLFFVILVILIVILIYLGESMRTPKISQNLPISYYVELDLDQFNQVSGPWLENSPDREKLLNLWDQYLEKIIIKPPKKLFINKISLIGLDMSDMPGDSMLSMEKEKGRFQDSENNEILFRAGISSRQIALNYLKKLGSTQFNNEQGITAIALKQPILGKNKYYYHIKDNQITVSSNVDLLNLPNNKIKFPKKNILSHIYSSNRFLQIFTKPSNISFLNLIMPDTIESNWIFAQINPQKLIINFENQGPDAKIINNSWLKLVPSIPNIAFFSKDISNILKNYSSNIIPHQELQTFAKDKQSLLIFSPKDANFSINPSDYNYVLAVSNSKNFNSNSPEIKEIEQKIKKIFAKKFPTEKITYLPDNSTITEFISNPEIFEFQTSNLANIRINYLRKPNLEFAYLFYENNMLFSDSITLLEQVVSQNRIQTQDIEDLFADCLINENIFSDFILFNSDLSFQQNYGVKKAIITNKKACVY